MLSEAACICESGEKKDQSSPFSPHFRLLLSQFSRAATARAKLDQDQSAKKMNYLKHQAELGITTALRSIQTDYERVEAYKVASDLAQQKLQAEEAKFKAELSNNYLALQCQRDLAEARSAELRAITDYNLSRSRLDRASGVSLKNRIIKLTDVPLGDLG